MNILRRKVREARRSAYWKPGVRNNKGVRWMEQQVPREIDETDEQYFERAAKHANHRRVKST